MAASTPWRISVTRALRAYFTQPSGPNRAGTDWAVALTREGKENHILVRTYLDEVGDLPPRDESRLVANYIVALLESGWTPDQYRGLPGELVVDPKRTAAREDKDPQSDHSSGSAEA